MNTQYGWHLIGNPFTFDLPMTRITAASELLPRTVTELVEAGLMDILSFDGIEFTDASDTLKAFEGYALYIDECLDVFDCDEGSSGALNFYSDSAMVPTTPSSKQEVALEDWAIRIGAYQGEARDRFNYAAVSVTASADWDPLDRPEPPVIGDYVSVSFAHPEWGHPAVRYRRDTRPTPEDGEAWLLGVRTRTFDPVELRFDGLEEVPVRFGVWLIDERSGVRQNLREDPTYTLAGPGEEHPAPLSLAVGTEQFMTNGFQDSRPLPTRAELLPVYPNPFSGSATVRYVLPEVSSVRLEVVDVLGRRVRVLQAGASTTAGYHEKVWDGRSEDGAQVAGGLYFVRLKAEGRVHTKSVIVAR
jgi:hypothetical protein